MAKVYRDYQPDQDFLLPPSLKEWLPERHPAYFISEVVDGLDLTEILEHYERAARGQPPYHPRMMTKVLFYGYCMGVRSSRKIARELEENVAFRVLAANNQPDFRTISDFRKIHLKRLKKLFVQVLRLCQQGGLVKLGHVALDGTKVKANASKHKAMSYERMCQAEKELEAAARRKAEESQPDAGPAEKRCVAPKKKRRAPKAATGKPAPKAQYNFTDPESRIMKNSDKAYVQAYNALAAVDGANQIIVACEVSDNPADSVSTVEMVEQVERNCGKKPKRILADAGHFSEHNVVTLEQRGMDVYICPEKQRHTQKPEPAPRGRMPARLSVKERMRRKLRTKEGRETYAKRKWIVEPPFGQIKEARGIRRFLLRGKRKVSGEWSLIATTHNLLKLYVSGRYRWATPA